MAGGFCLDWFAGASAQVELFSPPPASGGGHGVYQLKYTPAFRSTIRPPVEDRPLGQGELDPINDGLDHLVTALDARSASTGANADPSGPDPLRDMEMLGNQLLDLVLPQYVQADFRGAELWLEIGMDEMLLEYPWELMYDGAQFLCLRHNIGRFVNATPRPFRARTPITHIGSSISKLSILIVSVPQPQPRGDVKYDKLLAAEAETDAIIEGLKDVDGVTVATLTGNKATYNEVYKTLSEGYYEIVHFTGHAFFDDAKPRNSSLVLFDRDMTTGAILGFLGKNPPILCFVNGCETAKTGKWKERYNIFGLAQAFLDTGAYLLGNRWRINDSAAKEFGKQFYLSLLREHRSLGCAVREARVAAKTAAPNEFAWASYVLYGDPRVCFRVL